MAERAKVILTVGPFTEVLNRLPDAIRLRCLALIAAGSLPTAVHDGLTEEQLDLLLARAIADSGVRAH